MKREIYYYKEKLKAMPLVFLFLGLFSISCDEEVRDFNLENIEGEWVIAAVELDQDFYKPSTGVFEFKNDSLYIKDFKGKVLKADVISIGQDSIRVGTRAMSKDQFYIKDEVLYFNRLLGYSLKKASAPIAKKEFELKLHHSDWRYSKGLYRFQQNNELLFVSNEDSTYIKNCYDLEQYRDQLLLFKKGNQLDCNRDSQFVEQVVQWTDSTFVTYGMRDGTFQNIYYSSIDKEEQWFKKPSEFQLCNGYINKNYPSDRYYYKGTVFNGGLYAIRKIVADQYVVPENITESGIFQVRFVVNCEGKAGMFEYQAFDFEYKLKDFSAEIANQLLAISKTLQDWIPGRDQSGQPIDTYKYLNYRIENGKIILLYP